MILAIDVQYEGDVGYVAGVMFEEWSASSPLSEHASSVTNIAAYEPGSFYKRELPCILQLLREHKLQPSTIVVDGYVFLDGKALPGLGKRLFNALSHRATVVGVAKEPYAGISDEFALLRGRSKKPLYITSTGNPEYARKCIAGMHGNNRIPVLLKRVDQLCRAAARDATHGEAD